MNLDASQEALGKALDRAKMGEDQDWTELYPESTKWDGATFHEISEEFLEHLEQNLD